MSAEDEKSALRNPESAIVNRLIIFTRYPEPGRTKTRLIPALGPEGAADLHRRMGEQTINWARELKSCSSIPVEVRYEGGNENLIRQWIGSDMPCFPQGNGDLGSRMTRAFHEAFAAGMNRVIIVGTDCPGLTAALLQRGFEALQFHDLVLGPAKDGGYYLIGLKRFTPRLFREIPWGTSEVLSKTLQFVHELKLRVFLLDPLDDVDRPEDLPIWEKFATAPSRPSPLISIIIPTLNEEKTISACLGGTQNAINVERIVADGGSRDRTVEVSRSCGATVIHSPKGRARQMNAGAQAAAGEVLLFLHADTCLPSGFASTVRHTLALPGIVAGAFEFRLDAPSPGLRLIERTTNWRSRRLQMPYGDQAIFVPAALFHEIGGFPDIPIMEDFEFIRRIKRKGRIHIVRQPAITSARRWHALGLWKTTLINQLIIIAYYLGIPPARIHRWAHRNP